MRSTYIPMLCLTFHPLTRWPHTLGSSAALLFLSLKNSLWPPTSGCQGTSPHMINDSSASPQVVCFHFNLHKAGDVLLFGRRKWITHTARGVEVWNVEGSMSLLYIRAVIRTSEKHLIAGTFAGYWVNERLTVFSFPAVNKINGAVEGGSFAVQYKHINAENILEFNLKTSLVSL